MRPLYYLFLFLFGYKSLYAQQPAIDSLEKQLTQSLPDTVRALSLMRLAIHYEAVDTAKSMRAYKEAIFLTREKKLNYEAARIYANQSILQYTGGFYREASVSQDSALYLYEHSDHPDALFRKGQLYNEMANVARHTNNSEKAIDYWMENISILEKLNKNVNLINSYLNLSAFYKDQHEYEKQELYAKKALETSKKTGRDEDFFKSYAMIAFALCQQGENEKASNYVDSSRRTYADSYPQDVLVTFHLVAGLVYMNIKELEKAAAEFTASYAVAEKYKSNYGIIQSRLQLARVLTLQKKFKDAEPLLLAAYEDAKKSNVNSQLIIALDYLSRFYDEKEEFKKALFYHKEYKIIADSVASDENKKYASRLEVQYETEKKVSQIKQLEDDKKIQDLTLSRKDTLNYILIGSAVALLLVSLLLYRTYRQRQKIQQQRINELETEKKLEATEAVLKGEEQERTRLAKDLHDGLGGMLSGIKYSLNTMKGNLIMTPDNTQAFERSMDMLDSSIKEMRRVAHNMMPEALVKFGLDTALKDFCNDINQSGVLKINYQSIGLDNASIDQTTGITIYRIVQELINNTIKHAAAKTAIVQIAKNNNQITVTVEDDGKGFDTSILSIPKGIGWNNIQSRVEFLKGKLDIQSSPGNGTSVQIELDS